MMRQVSDDDEEDEGVMDTKQQQYKEETRKLHKLVQQLEQEKNDLEAKLIQSQARGL